MSKRMPPVSTGATTVTALGQLLARLALDPILHAAFLQNPGLVIDSAGLEAEEAEALIKGDWDQIKVFLGTGSKPMPSGEGSGNEGGGGGG